MQKIIVVKYGELWLKSDPVRRRFEKILKKNIKRELSKTNSNSEILLRNGRVFLYPEKKLDLSFLKRTFGVVSYAEGLQVRKDMEEIKKAAEKLIRKKKTFVIRAKRSDKSFQLDSQEIQRTVGMYLESLGHSADIQAPQQTIRIEIRDQAYVYSSEAKGPGGMPLGTGGSVNAMLRNENDLAAAWLIMKRGVDCFFVKPNAKQLKVVSKWIVGRKTMKATVSAKSKDKIRTLVTSDEIAPAKNKNIILNPLVGFTDKEKKKLIKKIKKG